MREVRTLTIQPCWEEKPAEISAESIDGTLHLVILCGGDRSLEVELQSRMTRVSVIRLEHSESDELSYRYTSTVIRVLEEIQQVMLNFSDVSVLLQVVVFQDTDSILWAGLYGLLQTAHLEQPSLRTQLIEVESVLIDADLVLQLELEARFSYDLHIRYRKGMRMVRNWNLTTEEQVPNGAPSASRCLQPQLDIPWKDKGVYLITGGAGGVGLHVANDIICTTEASIVILVGRSPFNESIKEKLRRHDPESRMIYIQTDVTDLNAVSALIRKIRTDFGELNGIIHGAGIIKDRFILKKTKAELEEVLSPKVNGVVYLDEASIEERLDFFICFSSVVGVTGNVGQADYAAANGFLDAYAEYRNNLVDLGLRKGRTITINWPLWEEGGMTIHEENRLNIQHMGISELPTQAAIEALYKVYNSGWERALVFHGDPEKLPDFLTNRRIRVGSKLESIPVPEVDYRLLLEKTGERLKALFSEVTGLRVAQINLREMLESYGIDSIMIVQMNRKLGEIFGEINKTLFYQYQTLEAAAGYLVSEYSDACAHWTGMNRVEEIESSSPLISADNLVTSSIESNAGTDTYSFPILHSWKKDMRDGIVGTASSSRRQQATREPIAIIGMSGKFPKADSMEQYWDNLLHGIDCISEIPEERWRLDECYHSDPQTAMEQGKSYCKWGGFLEGFADFDPLLFHISPQEALNMDPQERVFLQSCWEVFEDAGYTREQIALKHQGKVGVFVGITKTGYNLYGPPAWNKSEAFFPYTSFGSAANRISYLFNLKGPSMPIDTMCSSSLTAIHEACEHLHQGSCEMAIAGGVNLYLHPSNYAFLSAQRMLSAHGKCRSFGAGADGFVPGEGVGAVLLKPLAQAIADQDHVYAVIRGTSINHGGKTNGYTVPNPAAQAELINEALDRSGINARTVSYIEAHGTGTELGDPIEISGLTQAFRKDTSDTGFCSIGSVKSTIGHLEAAAGIAGLIKIVLQMKHQQLVPSLHAEDKNPNIPFEESPFSVQCEAGNWNRPVLEQNGEIIEIPRRAGISSFGAGGANAHIIVEEFNLHEDAISSHPVESTLGPVMIALSAKNKERLQEMARNLLGSLVELEAAGKSLRDIAYTLQVGREAMEERLAVVAHSYGDLTYKVTAWLEDQYNTEDLFYGHSNRHSEEWRVFTADDELKAAVDLWIERRKYARILELWVKGLEVDWNRLYKQSPPKRISLPTYPFAKEKYWISQENIIRTETSVGELLGSDDTLIDRLLDEVMNGNLSIDSAVRQSKAAVDRTKVL